MVHFNFDLEGWSCSRVFTATSGNYYIPNFRINSTTSLDSKMGVGDVISITLIVASSSHYLIIIFS